MNKSISGRIYFIKRNYLKSESVQVLDHRNKNFGYNRNTLQYEREVEIELSDETKIMDREVKSTASFEFGYLYRF